MHAIGHSFIAIFCPGYHNSIYEDSLVWVEGLHNFFNYKPIRADALRYSCIHKTIASTINNSTIYGMVETILV